MRAFVATDMEGVSGCVAGGYGMSLTAETRARYHKLMMGEINAVVEGCVQAGAEEIVVGEAHPVDLAELHPAAELARGVPWQDCFKLREFGAVLFVGQHARTGLADGVRSHTGSSNSIMDVRVNGEPVGELALFGALAGARGIPVVFLAGDSRACEEAEALIEGPVVTVAVMESHNVLGAVCLPPAKTHPLLTEGARTALGRVDKIKPIRVEGPVTFVIEFKHARIADEHCIVPGVERVGPRTVSFSADTYEQAYRGAWATLAAVLHKYDA